MQNYDPMTTWERDLFEATYQLDDSETITSASVLITRRDNSPSPDGMVRLTPAQVLDSIAPRLNGR